MRGVLTVLRVGQDEVNNVFELVGQDEDSISLAIAWALRSCPRFLKAVVSRVAGAGWSIDDVTITVHRYEKNGGITDIKVECQRRSESRVAWPV